MAKKKKYKILMAEDDKFLVDVFREASKKESFDFVSAFDGQEAVEKLKKEKPDLLLLDLMMPQKDGFEVLEEIKFSDKFKNIPVVVFSVLGQQSDIKKALDLGAAEYLVKSDFSVIEVVQKLKEHLLKSRIKNG